MKHMPSKPLQDHKAKPACVCENVLIVALLRTRRHPVGLLTSLVFTAISLACVVPLSADEAKSKNAAPPPKKTQKKSQIELKGAELYAVHCNRCHPERYASERTAEQWKTILLHMRTRANLPADQAKKVLQFLQENSGSN